MKVSSGVEIKKEEVREGERERDKLKELQNASTDGVRRSKSVLHRLIFQLRKLLTGMSIATSTDVIVHVLILFYISKCTNYAFVHIALFSSSIFSMLRGVILNGSFDFIIIFYE